MFWYTNFFFKKRNVGQRAYPSPHLKAYAFTFEYRFHFGLSLGLFKYLFNPILRIPDRIFFIGARTISGFMWH